MYEHYSRLIPAELAELGSDSDHGRLYDIEELRQLLQGLLSAQVKLELLALDEMVSENGYWTLHGQTLYLSKVDDRYLASRYRNEPWRSFQDWLEEIESWKHDLAEYKYCLELFEPDDKPISCWASLKSLFNSPL